MSVARVMISMPKQFLEEIDRVAEEEGRSRSELLREAVRLYLQVRKARSVPGQNPVVQRAVAIQDAIARQDSVKWDGIAEIRRWRERR